MDSHITGKTWIEINKDAVRKNIGVVKKLVSKKTKLMAVVKSNAYGHGLTVFSKLADKLGVFGFCVDSVEEGRALRASGIRKPILVLGYTVPQNFSIAAKYNLTLTISTFESLDRVVREKIQPKVHLKFDTGMHRQGFYKKDVRRVVQIVKKFAIPLEGIYTHFASAKDPRCRTYTETQFENFKAVDDLFQKAKFSNLVRHVAATGATLLDKKYHLEWVRVGIGLYGEWPSRELEMSLGDELILSPVLSWYSVVSELKKIKKGDYVGYDLTYRAPRNQEVAVIPIGYWHGLPRVYGENGSVLVRGKEARTLGRVSMDMIVVDVSDISCKVGDVVTLIGRSRGETLRACDIARRMGASHYELLTRLNPLIERIVV